jgi:hypothetical protein
MKIIKNTSVFDTPFIKRACVVTHTHMAKVEGRLAQWDHLSLKVENKRCGYSGHAYYNGTYMHFSLSPHLLVKQLVALAYHELMHIYGYRHRQGCDPSLKDIAIICEALAIDPDTPVPQSQLKAALKRDLVEDRYQRMLARQRTWATKLSRAQKAYEKVTKEIAAYQRRHGERINGN